MSAARTGVDLNSRAPRPTPIRPSALPPRTTPSSTPTVGPGVMVDEADTDGEAAFESETLDVELLVGLLL